MEIKSEKLQIGIDKWTRVQLVGDLLYVQPTQFNVFISYRIDSDNIVPK